MNLKGHTKIELTDVNTGEVQVIEEDNTVTSGLETLFSHFGIFDGILLSHANVHPNSSLAPLTNQYGKTSLYGYDTVDHTQLLKSLTGGLLLYDKDISTSKEDDIIYVPGGVEMTGHGSYRINAGTDTSMGVYEPLESGEIYDGYGYKHVWDFNTQQGNGDISSICLTTTAGGTIGTGTTINSNIFFNPHVNSSDKQTLTYESYYDSMPSYIRPYYYRITKTENAYDLPIQVRLEQNQLTWLKNALHPSIAEADPNQVRYFINRTTQEVDSNLFLTQEMINNSFLVKQTLDFKITRLPINNLSIFDFIHYEKNNSFQIVQDNISIELPQLKEIITDEMKKLNSSYYFYYDTFTEDNYLYFFMKITTARTSLTPPGENIGYLWKINLETFQIENYLDIKNPSLYSVYTSFLQKNDYYNTKDYIQYADSSLMTNTEKNFIVTNDCLLCFTANSEGTGKNILVINLNDFTFNFIINETGKIKSYQKDRVFSTFLCINNKIYWTYLNDVNNNMQIIDLKTFTCKRMNITLSHWLHYEYAPEYRNDNNQPLQGHIANTKMLKCLNSNIIAVFSFYQSSGKSVSTYPMSIKFMCLPTILITINNLEQTFTKGDTQTMKITYTLVDEDYYNKNLKTT